jgi:sulfatase-modifying factor enzyme 1
MNATHLLNVTLVTLLASVSLTLTHGTASANTCTPDSVSVGPLCVDKYEASVWEIHGRSTLIPQIRNGTATADTLRTGAAIQRGVGDATDYPCDENGNDCDTIYAVSIPGVRPSANITWFQAQQACLNAGKRLLTNAEWQGAVAGTPDPGTDNGSTDCNISGLDSAVNTGSRAACVSRWGVFDMVGNLWEWVADWGVPSLFCAPELFPGTGDFNCLTGVDTSYGPGALLRGGSFGYGALAGVFAVDGGSEPSWPDRKIGFRCAR